MGGDLPPQLIAVLQVLNLAIENLSHSYRFRGSAVGWGRVSHGGVAD